MNEQEEQKNIIGYNPNIGMVTADNDVIVPTPVLGEKQICGRCSKPKEITIDLDGKDFLLNRKTAKEIENPKDFICMCGRPTKYEGDEIMVAKVEEYLATCVDKEREIDKGYKIIVKLPKREGLALFLDVDMGTLSEWEEEYPEFSRALSKIDKEQKERLINNGLSGDYNSTIAKLILSANHGMAEKTEQDIKTNGKEIQGLAVSFIKPDDSQS